MKLRTFLPLLTYPDASTQESVANAAAVARLLGADLHALAIEADIPQVSNALSRVLLNLPEMILDAEKLSTHNGAKLLAAAKSAASAEALVVTTSETKTQLALIGDVAAGHARYFDLALIGWTPETPAIRMMAEAVVFGSGRPVILMPDAVSIGKLDRICIAWDGSRVAARAAADARLLLERASAITVVTVTDEKPLKEKDTGERLAESLRAGGLKADFSAVQAEDGPIAETLQGHAADLGADLLVMGGYGHSRLRDFVLGGATEGVLADLRLPVLVSH